LVDIAIRRAKVRPPPAVVRAEDRGDKDDLLILEFASRLTNIVDGECNDRRRVELPNVRSRFDDLKHTAPWQGELRKARELPIRYRNAFGCNRQAHDVAKERHGLLKIGGAGKYPVDAFSDFHGILCHTKAVRYRSIALSQGVHMKYSGYVKVHL
jgi:hypothetical protein